MKLITATQQESDLDQFKSEGSPPNTLNILNLPQKTSFVQNVIEEDEDDDDNYSTYFKSFTFLFHRLIPIFVASFVLLIIGSLWLWSHTPTLLAARIHYVAPTGTDSGNCAFGTPCQTIGQAISNANDGDEIRVATGTYTESLTINKNLTLQGGFTTSNWTTSDPDLNPTIIKPSSGRVILVDNTGGVVSVSGFHLTRGSETLGAGVYNQNGSLTLKNNKIYNNTASGAAGGGGISSDATLILRNNDVYSNTADKGGGVSIASGSTVIEANRIFSNTASSSNAVGGGIEVKAGGNAVVTIINNLIYTNTSTGGGTPSGGGIAINDGTVTLENNTLYDNTTNVGGGLLVFNATAILTNNLIISNTATHVTLKGGGIFSNTGAIITMVSTDFFGNSPDEMAKLPAGTSIDPTSIGTNNRISDPFFTNPSTFDLHLSSNSPAIDTAASTTITSDYEGHARPFGSGIDRGADEYIDLSSTCFARIQNSQVYTGLTGLQTAINLAGSGGIVQVAGRCEGVQSTGGVTQTVYISQTMTLRGGYTVTDWVDPAYGPTVLDANSQGRVVYMIGSGTINPTLENFHITGGSYTGSGGGIYLGNNVNSTLNNNVIYNNTVTSQGGGIYNSGGGDATLQHNTIYSNTAAQGGAVTAGTANGTGEVILDNTIVVTNSATTGGGIYVPTGGRATLRYNNFYANTNNNYSGITTGTTDISVDPGLTDPTGGDFHLKLSSSLIDVADPNSTLVTDFENDTRPQSVRRDIGADESLFYTGVDLNDLLSPNNPYVITDTQAASNTVVTFTHTITNIGNTGSLTDTVNISTLNSHGWTVTPANQTLVLTVGVPISFNIVVSIPITDLTGIFNQTFITATSTSNAAGTDSTVDVIGNPGLEFTPDYTRFGDPGEVITYTHILTNTGPAGTFIITFNSSRNWAQTISPTTVTLAYNESAQIVAVVRITDSAPVNLTDITLVTATINFGGFAVSKTVTDTTTANATPGDRYVAEGASGGNDFENNCTVTSQPCATILYALGQSANGDDIYIAQGTFNITGTLLINQNVSFYGSRVFPGNFGVPPVGGIDPATTIIKKSGGSNFVGLRITASPPSFPVMEGFTLEDFTNPSGNGGGIWVQGNASPKLQHLIISNTVAANGGGIFIESGTPDLDDVTINDASASLFGGGMYVDTGNPTMNNVRIINSQTTGGSGQGGGIYINSGSPLVNNSTISNTTSILGGGIYLESGSPVLTNSTIYSTSGTTGGGIYQAGGNLTLLGGTIFSASATTGGGIYQAGGSLTGQKLTVENNRATAQGGGVYQVAGTILISQTRISSNTATSGGGLYSPNGSLSLWNNFVYSNTATTGNGGGVYKDGGILNLVNDTLYGNQAANQGGGLFDNNSGSLVLSNTIVAANQANTGGGVYRLSSGFSSIDYNNFWNNSATTNPDHNLSSAGANSISADPAFVNAASGDLHLTLDSPSVDTADPNTFLTGDIEDDLRPIGQGSDMGADEVAGCLSRVTDPGRVPRFGGKVFGVLQEAIDAASPSDIVQIFGDCRGVHGRLVNGQVISQTALISKSLTLEGGYNSSFSNDPIGNPPSIVPASLDARGLGRTVVVTATASGNPTVNILILTLTNGDAQGLGGGPANGDAGGGIYNYNSFLFINSTIISNNQATYGGGIYHYPKEANMLKLGETGKTTIISNTALNGGGLYVEGSSGTPTIKQTVFEQNQASSDGGGLYVDGGSLSIQNNSRFEQNSANQGGGLYNAGGSISISQTVLYSNTATTNGGSIYNNGTIDSDQLTVNGNSANQGGGLFNQSSGTLTVQRSLILTNTAGAGGGLYNNGNLSLINTIVSSNTTTGNGGGLYNDSNQLTLRHNTFYGNSTSGGVGGGIYHNATSAAPIINSTMIVNNSTGFSSVGITPTFRYNLLDNIGVDVSGFSPDGTNLIAVAPSFISIDPTSNGFLRIQSNSRGEEEGDPSSPITIDIDSDPRPSNQQFDIGVDEIANCFVQINGLPPTYGKVQVAVGLSNPGDEIRVAGICQGADPFIDGGQTVSQTIFLTKSLTIRGGYTKDDFTTSSPLANPTILDALSLGRVVYVTNTAQVTVTGLHLKNGNSVNGGAVFVGDGNLIMTQNQIYSNTATNGGALYNQAGTVYIYEDVFTNTIPYGIFTNTATTAGGAIYNAGGQITLNTVDVRNNTVTSGGGGAFYHAGGTALLQNNIIRNNSVTGNGGAIYNAGSGLSVWHNTLYSNSASGDGGGLYTTNNTPDVRNNIFRNNTGNNVIHDGNSSYNIDYNNVSGGATAYGGTVSPGANSSTSDPLLVDPTNGDFHIADNSPVIDQGDPTMSAFQDFEDDYRPGDQNFDMGADERRSCWAQVVTSGAPYSNSSGPIYGNLQRAINHSQPGDEIRVSIGECRGVHTYVDGSKTLSQTVHITHNLTIIGSFTDGGSPSQQGFNANVGGPANYPDPNATTLNALNLGRVVLITGGTTIDMQRFILINGDATGLGGGPSGGDAGGGFYYNGSQGNIEHVDYYFNTAAYGGAFFNNSNQFTNFTMNNSWIRYNQAITDGGAIYNVAGNMTINGATVVYSSTVGRWGGGIFNDSGNITLENNNELDLNQANQGGFFYNATGVVTMTNNNITNNTATSDGGGIYNAGGVITMTSNTVSNNSATNNNGGAIYNDTGQMFVGVHTEDTVNTTGSTTGNVINGNQATNGSGGGIYNNSGQISLLRNTINNNTAKDSTGGHGGGLYNGSSGTATIDRGNIFHNNSAHQGAAIYHTGGNGLTMHNSVVYTNTAKDQGGALFIEAGSPEILHNTFYDNAATAAGTTQGGAIYITSNGTPIIKNNIFDSNIADTGNAIRKAGSGGTFDYNDYWPGDGASQASPSSIVGANSLNLNPTFVNAPSADFHLSSLSPIIGRAQAGLGVDHDFENDPRPVNGLPDIGADEDNSCLVQLVQTDSDGDGDPLTGALADGPTFGSIQAALNAAFLDQTIRVAAGTCYENLSVDKRVTIDGSWINNFSAPVTANDPILGLVRIVATTVDAGNLDRVVDILAAAQSPTFSYLRFENGKTTGAGGGIKSRASVAIINSIIDSNQSTWGGGIFLEDNLGIIATLSSGESHGVIVSNNQATSQVGGGIYVGIGNTLNMSGGDVRSNSAPIGGGIYHANNVTSTLSSVIISSNSATSGNGAGVYNGSNSEVSVTGSTLSGNIAGSHGGGMYNGTNSKVTISSGGISGNTASGNGGGMYNDSGSYIDIGGGFPIDGNQAMNGGGVYNTNATFILAQKRINNNWTTAVNGVGGGIYADLNSVLTTTNLGLYNNTANDDGGGLYQIGNTQSVHYHATIRQNNAGGQGGGVYADSGTSTVISASIVAFNTSTAEGSGVYGNGANITIDYTLRWSNDYSGTTYTLSNEPTPANPQFRNTAGDLYYNSPAIDAVPTAASHVTVDRNLDTRPQLCGKDMGRDEYGVGARAMTFVNSPTPLGTTLAPGASVTYTFSLRNDSENWWVMADSTTSLGPGTGYTETIAITTTSSQNWAELVTIAGAANVVSQTVTKPHTATFDVGPGDTVTLEVKVTVPFGTAANIVDSTYIQYQAFECTNYVSLSTTPSTAADTRVIEDFNFIIEPDNIGAALPGGTVTYTHIITNIGNIQDTYILQSQGGFYASAQIISPTSASPPNPPQITLSPNQTATIVMNVTIRPEIAGDLQNVSFAIATSVGGATTKSAADTTHISPTIGTRFVSTTGNDDPVKATVEKDNNCTDQFISCQTIQHAIGQAASGDEIKIAEGVYSNTITTTYKTQLLTQTVFITKPVTLRGGYVAPAYVDPPDHLTNTAYIDPQGQGRGIFIGQLITSSGSITIDRLFIRNGNAGQGGGTNAGGNIYNEGADLTLSASRLYSGSATNGAGLYNASDNLLLQNNLLYNNTATSNGGGLYITGTATLQNNTFADNQATNGGTIYITDNGTVSIENTIFATNTATSGTGGAVEASGTTSTPNLDYNIHFNNSGGAADVIGINETNRINGNPQFVSPPYLYIAGTSPARDAGLDLSGVLDIDHQNSSRPLGFGYDIGAYEFVTIFRTSFFSDTTATVAEGGTVTITHTLQNTGNSTNTYTLTATTPPIGWTTDHNPALLSPIVLAAGASQTVVVTYTTPASSSGQIETFIITATGTGTFDTVQDTIIVSAPRWGIGKVATPSNTVQPGGLLTYTIIITNIGEKDTSGTFTVTDELPQNTYFVNAVGSSPVMTTPIVKWVTDTTILSNNGTISFTYVVTVSKPLTHGLDIINQVYTVTGGSAFTDATGTPVTVTVYAPPTLSITKTANAVLVQPGDYLTYTITITNDASAPGPALAVTVTDTLPPEVEPQQLGFVPPTTGNTSAVGNNLTWQLTNPIQPGETVQVTVTARVTSPLAAQTILTNTSSVTAGNITATLSVSITTLVTATNNITLHKTVQPAFVAAGGTVTYTIILTNSGNGVANVTLDDTLDPAFTPPTFNTNVLVPGKTWATSSGVVSVSFAATTPGSTGIYFNQAVTATYGLSQTTLSNTAPVSVTVANLSISKTIQLTNDPAQRGDPITYTVVVANSSLADAANINITDTLPNFVNGSNLNETVTVTGGESITFVITATVANNAPYGGVITNTAYYTHTSSNNQASITFTVELTPPANLSIIKTVQLTNNPAQHNDLITYTIVVSNTGGLDATSANITDTLPTYINGSTLNATVTVTAGESVTFTIVGTVTTSAPYNAIITNTAYVTHTSGGGNDSVAFTVEGPPPGTLFITKTVQLTNNPAKQGDPITYTIVVANSGGTDVNNIRITDTLPTYVSGSNLDQTVTVTANDRVTLTINASVVGSAPYNAIITNTAYYSQSSGGDADSASFTVEGPPPGILFITKTVQLTNNPAKHGDLITYTIVVANSGGTDVNNVRITDTLPTYVSGSNLDQTVTVTANDRVTLTINASVVGSAPYNAVITNTAYYSQSSGGGNNSAAFTVEGPLPGILDITKNVQLTNNPARRGDAITYTIVVSNSGGIDVNNVRITDTLPTYVSGSNLDQTVTVTANDRVTLTINASVTGSAPFSTVITNTAYYSQSSGGGNDSAAFITEPQPPSFLFITKTLQLSNNPVQHGDAITYTVIVANSDTLDATNVRLTDTLPSLYINGNNLDVTVTVTAGMSVTYTIPATVSLSTPYNAIITNTAYYSYTTAGTDSASFSVRSPSPSTLNITKTVQLSNNPAQQGDAITYTIVMANSNGLDVSNIRITDTLPSEVNGLNLDQVVTITANDRITLTIPATVLGSAPYNAIVTNTAYYTQPSGGGNDSATFTIQSPTPGDLSITKTVQLTNDPAQHNDTITYTVVVANNGSIDISNVRITDTLPTYINGSDLDQTVTVTANDRVTLTISAIISTSTPYNAIITNTAYYTQPSGGDNDNAVLVVTGPPSSTLAITKSVQLSNNPVQQGDAITYTIVVANNNSLDISNIRITDTLPPEINGLDLDQVVTITANDQITLTIPTTVSLSAAYNAIVTNTAYYSQSSGSSSDSAAFTIQAPSPSDLSITKTVKLTNDPAQRNDVITYTIVVANKGSIDISNIRITDTLPSDVIGSNVDQTVTVTANDRLTITILANVSGSAPYNQVITNTAYYTQPSGGGNSSATFSTVSTPPANLAITKTVTPTNVEPGGAITYVLTFVNYGPPTAQGVIITDSVPTTVTNLSVISSGIAITDTGGTFTWQVQDLAQGQQGIITITGQVNLGLSAGYMFTNTATITASAADTNTLDNESQAGVTIIPAGAAGIPTLIAPADGTYTNMQATNLVWSRSNNAVSYTLHLSGSTFNFPDPGSGNVISAAVLAEGVYTWTVEAFNANGISSGLATTWVFTVDLTAPNPAPGLLLPTNGDVISNTLRPTFMWGASTDTLSGPVTYTIIITSSSGTSVYTSSTVMFTPSSDLAVGVNTWTVIAHDKAGNSTPSSNVFTFTIQSTVGDIYLPIVLKNFVPGVIPPTFPDLTALQFIIDPPGALPSTTPITLGVVIQNIGTATAPANFWVDFYIDPTFFPTQAGFIWGDLCQTPGCINDYGLAWQVTTTLAPGQVITLTSLVSDPYLVPTHTQWPGSFPTSGNRQVGVYVDSWNGYGVTQGFVIESNETNNRLAPTGIVVTGLSLELNSEDLSREPLPDRPLPTQ